MVHQIHWNIVNSKGKIVSIKTGWLPPIRLLFHTRPCLKAWSEFDYKKHRWVNHGKLDVDKGYCVLAGTEKGEGR